MIDQDRPPRSSVPFAVLPATAALVALVTLVASGCAASPAAPSAAAPDSRSDAPVLRRTIAVRAVTGEHVPARVRLGADAAWQRIDAYGGREFAIPASLGPDDIVVDGERVARVLTSDDAWLVLLENAPVTMEFRLVDEAREQLGLHAELVLLDPFTADLSITPHMKELHRSRFDAAGRARALVPPNVVVQARAAVPGGDRATLTIDPRVEDETERNGVFGMIETTDITEPILVGLAPDLDFDPVEIQVVDANGDPVVGALVDRYFLDGSDPNRPLLGSKGPPATTDGTGVALITDVDRMTIAQFEGIRVRHAGATYLAFQGGQRSERLVLDHGDASGATRIPLAFGEPLHLVEFADLDMDSMENGRRTVRAAARTTTEPSLPPGTAVYFRSPSGDTSGIAAAMPDDEIERFALPDGESHLTVGSRSDANLRCRGSVVAIHGAGDSLFHATQFDTPLGEPIALSSTAGANFVRIVLETSVTVGVALLDTRMDGVPDAAIELVEGDRRVRLESFEVRVVDEDASPLPFAPVWAHRNTPLPQRPAFTDAKGRLTLLAPARAARWGAIQALTDWSLVPAAGELTLLSSDATTTLVATPHTR